MADGKINLPGLGNAKPQDEAKTETPVARPVESQTLRDQGGRNSLLNHPTKPVKGSSRSLADDSEPAARYSSHPIANYRLGRFHFDRGLLNLDSDDAAEFERLYQQLPITEQRRVTKLDVGAAERFLKERAANRTAGATKQFDSSVGERAGATPIGTEELGHASRSQMDANQVVDVNTNAPPPAEETAGKVVPHEA